MARRVSIKDVAQRAGVSWKTVSNVVNERPVVKEETRERVLTAIDDLGYVPNHVGRDLRGGPTRTISLVVPELQKPYFALLAEMLQVAARERGYSVSVEVSLHSAEVERAHVRGRVGRRVDAVIISPSALDRTELLAIVDEMPVVLLGEQLLGEKGVAHVAIDNVAAAADVVGHLVEQGYREPLFLGAEVRVRSAGTDRLAGFRAAGRMAGIADDPARAVSAPAWDMPDGYRAVKDVITSGLRFDSVVAGNDELAIGALAALREAGLRGPEDVGVVGWDNSVASRFTHPTLTSVAPDMDLLVEKTLDAALTTIDEESASPSASPSASTEFVVPHHLVVRGSSTRSGA
jgi:DNA-binding LacI/PurR family transcriptional regulator